MTADDHPCPPYSYVPGGPWPHPVVSPEGHSFGQRGEKVPPVDSDQWERSACYLRGIALFNAGYYWEAHEVWEALWHAHGRRGPIADLVKALIKLAASGVKVRERQVHGVVTHARRAADLFDSVRKEAGPTLLGLDLVAYAAAARSTAENPPIDPAPPGAPVSIALPFRIEPIR